MSNAHFALHFSREFRKRAFVLQTRRADGTFRSPTKVADEIPSLAASLVTAIPPFATFHVTLNGRPI